MKSPLALAAVALAASALASATEIRVSYSAAAFALDGAALLRLAVEPIELV